MMKELDKNLSYQDAQENLESLVREIESGELSIEEMIDKYEEGMMYYNFLLNKLNEMEQRISVLDEAGEKPYQEVEEDD